MIADRSSPAGNPEPTRQIRPSQMLFPIEATNRLRYDR
jgi:hypothetical protein